MNFVSTSIRDLRQCTTTVIGYVVLCVGVSFSYRYARDAFSGDAVYMFPAQVLSVIQLLLALYLGVAVSLIQAAYFARLAGHLGKPLWKCSGNREALRRFFVPWLILNLAGITFADIQERAYLAENNDVVQLTAMLLLLLHLAAIPAGAAIMHWGALEWHALGRIFKPFVRFPGLMIIPFFLAFVQYSAFYILFAIGATMFEENVMGIFLMQSTVELLLLPVDMLIFALVWHVCLLHGITPEEEDSDFDM